MQMTPFHRGGRVLNTSIGLEFHFVRFCPFSCLFCVLSTDTLLQRSDYKGPGGTAVNTPQINGFCAGQINGTDPYNPGNPITNWYTTYCEQMPGVACMVRSRALHLMLRPS